jgi:RNA recognition motif-containing protein
VRDDDLRRTFEQYGSIESVRMLDTKNCAFVTFHSLESAKAAHAGTYGLRINGVDLKINWGRAPQGGSRQDGGGGRSQDSGYGAGYGGGGGRYDGGYGGGQQGGYGGHSGGYDRPHREDQFLTPSPNIWIGNVDPNAPEHELRAIFDRFGPIERVKMHPQRNCAFVNFVELSSALAAKAEMTGYMFYGQPLKVNFGKARETRSQDRPYGDRERDRDQGRGPSYGSGYNDRPSYDQRGPAGDSHTAPQASAPVAPSIPISEPQGIPDEVKAMVDRLVDAFSKNPDLEAQTKNNQADNPKFSFLFPGREGHDYFLWKRYGSQLQNASSSSSSNGAGSQGPAVFRLPPGAQPLSANETEDLTGILRNLDASKDKINAGADFVARHADRSEAIAVTIFDYAFNHILPSQQVLHIVYLINEIFNMTRRAKADTSTPKDSAVLQLPSAFLIGSGLARLMNLSKNEETKGTLQQLLVHWQNENVFTQEQIEDLNADFDPSDSKKRKRDPSTGDAIDDIDAKRRAEAH